MTLSEAKKIYCIGIGGIGISAIAKLLVAQGKEVSGSDAIDSEIVQEAGTAGVKILIGNKAENIGDAEVIIYSEAVPLDNPERVKARELGLSEFSGAEALAELTKGKRLIAVAGTNGKSTTTALLGLLLEAGGFDPTVIVGSRVANFPLGNLRVGKSDWFVLEADEYMAKFLNLSPEIAVITNIEEDHLDFYRDISHISQTFQKFLDRVGENGRIFLNADDERCMNDLRHNRKLTAFGIDRQANYVAKNIEVREGRQWFEVFTEVGLPLNKISKISERLYTEVQPPYIGEFCLRIPGRFNVMNALAALSVAFELGISIDVAQAVLEKFGGIWRRFERVGEYNGALIISDYGHHPTAIAGTLEAAREFYPDRRIVLVFQPHHHHRTKSLFRDFVKSFASADVLILSEIYSVRGRDESERDVSSQDLARAVQETGKPVEVNFGGDLTQTEKKLREIIQPKDVVILMGAGDIDSLARKLVA